ncbi:MAG: glycosyl hydrolase family 28-related protein [Bacteroidota bacterium]
MRFVFALSFFVFTLQSFSQIIPQERRFDWTLAGLRDTSTTAFNIIDLQDYGINGDGINPNDAILNYVLDSIGDSGNILIFPTGSFLFNSSISLPENTVLRGQGNNLTKVLIHLNGNGHGIVIQGSIDTQTLDLNENGIKDSTHVFVNSQDFEIGDWIKISMDDDDLVTSTWALKTVGQICQIEDIEDDRLMLSSPLRLNFSLTRNPYVQKISTKQNIGIECLSIERLDNTAPAQSSVIYLNYAVNCWINGIESNKCTFSHVELMNSSNISVANSYFHHAHEYGSGGRAYGVTLHFTSNECRIENSVFEHLRHSMLLQAGANGNVLSYNYSLDPFWSSVPNNSAGELVLHGNYPFLNLFEQNHVQNMIIDNSHGPNGPYNTFFRNRADLYGLIFTADNSPNQNIVGNEITNMEIPYSVVNYIIQGEDHFIYGNNNKGTIDPENTQNLEDLSYGYSQQAPFVQNDQWAAIGPPSLLASSTIPAYESYSEGLSTMNLCTQNVINYAYDLTKGSIKLFPNPFENVLRIESEFELKELKVFNIYGQEMIAKKLNKNAIELSTFEWIPGTYFVHIQIGKEYYVNKVIKAG